MDAGRAGQGPVGEGGHAGAGAGGRGGAGELSMPSGGLGGEPEPAATADTTPPDIVSVSPVDGMTGVRADANIVVTFTEPMDEPETEPAFESDDLLASHIEFSWNADGTVMTVHPKDGLEYQDAAAGMPRSYSFSITTFGRDRDGNHLAVRHDFSFTTLARYDGTLTPVDVREVSESDPTTAQCVDGADSPEIGDNEKNQGMGIVLSFDLSSISGPAAPEDWTAATLSLATVLPATQLGQLVAYQVSSAPADASWGEPVISELGAFSNAGSATTVYLDVLSALSDDFAHRDERNGYTQYLVRYEDASNFDDMADLTQPSCTAMTLAVTYLAP
jgi:hypothetical protein